MRQLFLPVGRQPRAILHQRVGVTRQCQRGYVSVQAVDDGPGLLARTAMALLDADVLACLGFPVFGKGGVEFDIQLAGRVVGDIEQLDRLGLGDCTEAGTSQYGGEG